MAVVKVHNIYKTLEKSIKYVMNKDKTVCPNGIAYDVYSNCGLPWDADDVIGSMRITKAAYDASRTVGPPSTIQAWHIIQSFAPGEVDRDTAQQIGQELCERLFHDRYNFVVATHHDKNHIHNHIIVQPIEQDTLQRLYYVPHIPRWVHRSTLTQARACSDDLCRKYGLSVIEHERDPHATAREQIGELYARAEARSKKNVLRRAIDLAVIQSFSWVQLKEKLALEGISVITKGNDILFYAPEILGKRIRGRTLGPAFTQAALMERLSRDQLKEYIVANRMIRPYDERRTRIQLPGTHPPQFVILDNDMVIQHPHNWRIYIPPYFVPLLVARSGQICGTLSLEEFTKHFTQPERQTTTPPPRQSGLSRAYEGTKKGRYEAVMDQKFQNMADRLDRLAIFDAYLASEDRVEFLTGLRTLSHTYMDEIRAGVLANQIAQDQNQELPVDPDHIHDLERRTQIIRGALTKIQPASQQASKAEPAEKQAPQPDTPDINHSPKGHSR